MNLAKSPAKPTTTTGKTDLELCGCGRPAILRRVSKPGPNFGRYFYGCPKFATDEDETKCGYFRWEENPPKPKSRPAKATASAMRGKKHQRDIDCSEDNDDDIIIMPAKKTRFAEPAATTTNNGGGGRQVRFERAVDADYSTTGESSGVYSFTTDNEDDSVSFWLDLDERRPGLNRSASASSNESSSTFQDASDAGANLNLDPNPNANLDPTVPNDSDTNHTNLPTSVISSLSSLNRNRSPGLMTDAEREGHEDSSCGDFVVPTHPSDTNATSSQPQRAANPRTQFVSPRSPRSPHSPHTPTASASVAYPSPAVAYPSPISGGTGLNPAVTSAGATAPAESPESEPPLTNAEVIQIVSNQFARHERLMAGAQRSHSVVQAKYERLRHDFEELKRKNEILERENSILCRENDLTKAEKRLLKRELSNMRDEIEMLAAERNRAEVDNR